MNDDDQVISDLQVYDEVKSRLNDEKNIHIKQIEKYLNQNIITLAS